jgi:hypothetical protein
MAAEDSERVVTELLAALRKVERILAARTLELKDEPGWSDVTSAL